MNSSHVHFVVTSVLVCLPGPVRSQEPAPDPRERANQEYRLWIARGQFAGAIDDKKQANPAGQIGASLAEKPIENGKNFQKNSTKVEIEKLLKTWPDLKDGKPTEAEKLFAITKAYDEFVDVVTAIRLLRGKRMEEARKQQQIRASKPPPRAPSTPSLSLGEILGSTLLDQGTRVFKEASYSFELAKWRGEVASTANASLKISVIGKNMQALETAVQETLDAAKEILDKEYNCLMPALVADEHVLTYLADGLIQKAKRENVPTAPGATRGVPGNAPRRHELVYDVTNYFGVKCRATVVVEQNLSPPKEWRVSKENKTKGGFYDLRLAEGGN